MNLSAPSLNLQRVLHVIWGCTVTIMLQQQNQQAAWGCKGAQVSTKRECSQGIRVSARELDQVTHKLLFQVVQAGH